MAFALLCAGGTLRAGPAELFGLAGRWGGLADAAAAGASGPEASFFNPGGLALAETGSFTAGSLFHGAWLERPQGNQGFTWPMSLLLGVAVPFPLRGALAQRIWLGLQLTSPPKSLALARGHRSTDVFYPYYDNRMERLMLLPALAVRVFRRPGWGELGIGVGLNVLANLAGTVVAQEGALRSVEARVTEELETNVSAVVGLQYRWKDLAVGLSYRQAFAVDVSTVSSNFVAGAVLDLNIYLTTLYDPHTFSFGVQWSPGRWLLALQMDYGLWRFYKGPFVRVTSELPLVGSLESKPPDIPFQDTVSVRLGGERRFDLGRDVILALRLGAGFQTAAVPVQHGRTNMLDGHKVSASLGVGLDLGRLAGRRLWIDLHGRLTVVLPRDMAKELFLPDPECPAPPPGSADPDEVLVDDKPCDRTDPETLGFQTTNPGYPSIHSGGYVVSGGLSLGVEL